MTMEIQVQDTKQRGLGQIRILLADDHTILRESLRALFDAYDDIEIIGEASDGRQALAKVQELAPDVVVMDLALPELSGEEVIQRIIRQNTNAKVLVLTQYCDREHILSSIKAGASGYIPKRASASEVVSAIRTVYRGEYFLFPLVASALVQDYLHQSQDEPFNHLTKREREVLRMVVEGKTSREIADILPISLKTVSGYRTRITKKLGIHNRTELIKFAIRNGLVKVDDWMLQDIEPERNEHA
jgi:DNA-binding NarL/FixJ family response regulator